MAGIHTVRARSYAALVIDAKGKILHQVNAYAPVYPASLTKMMTLYLIFEALKKKKIRLSDRIVMCSYAAAQPPSKVELAAGDSITVGDAIQAMVVKSANNVAAAVEKFLGGSQAGFAKMMCEKARKLGMTNTTFRNANGLFHPQQKTTAFDMSLLGRALLRDFPNEYKYFNVSSFTFRGKQYKNHNHLLGKVPHVDGIKTGFISKSGFNIIVSLKPHKRERLFIVVMGGETVKSRDAHAEELIRAACDAPHTLHLVTAKMASQVFAKDAQRSKRLIATRAVTPQPSLDSLLALVDQDRRS